MLAYGEFDVAINPVITGKKAEYTCKFCGKTGVRKTMVTLDNANSGFLSAKCQCGRLTLFSDKHGNFYHAQR